jgi:hypothetical protein
MTQQAMCAEIERLRAALRTIANHSMTDSDVPHTANAFAAYAREVLQSNNATHKQSVQETNKDDGGVHFPGRDPRVDEII